MSEEILADVLSDSYKQHQRDMAIKTLGARTHLTIAKIAQLLEHPEHGTTIGGITLADLLGVSMESMESTDATDATEAPAKAAKAAKAPKVEAKQAKAPKAKKAAAAATSGKGSKPRLNRDVAYEEIKAAMAAHDGPCSNGDLVKATQYTAVQVRTFLNEMIEAGTATYDGKGRGMKYDLL